MSKNPKKALGTLREKEDWEKIKKLLQDWGVEEIDNLITHLDPLLKKIFEDGERVGRSYVYEKVLPEIRREEKEKCKKILEGLKEETTHQYCDAYNHRSCQREIGKDEAIESFNQKITKSLKELDG